MKKNLGILCLIIFAISCFLPYVSIGRIDATLFRLFSNTANKDLIGIIILGIGSVMLILEKEKIIPLVLTIAGAFFPILRFFNMVTSDVGRFFGIGGYLILLGILIQFYACLSSSNDTNKITNANKDVNEKNPE